MALLAASDSSSAFMARDNERDSLEPFRSQESKSPKLARRYFTRTGSLNIKKMLRDTPGLRTYHSQRSEVLRVSER